MNNTTTTELTEQQRKQNTFDAVWAHSAQMTKQSKDNDASCAYRSRCGNRCFIGALIPDSLYKRRFDDPLRSCGVKKIMKKKWGADVKAFFETESYSTDGDFLERLQVAHDTNFDTRQAALERDAAMYGLTIPQ